MASIEDLPKTQKAQVMEKAGTPLVYKDVPVRMPGPDEVLVNIKVRDIFVISRDVCA
jgi:alcohol dehydrogenase, propanol-preferring